MNRTHRLANWLETHWVAPSFGGSLLMAFAFFFFIAATNTLTGWLYVLSGIGAALLLVAAILPRRNLKALQVHREMIQAVSAGEPLTLTVCVENPTGAAKTLLELHDSLPRTLGLPKKQAIEVIAPKTVYRWSYAQATQQRGIYRWQNIRVRTAAPLGLFWYSRLYQAKATAVVYPTVLSLTHCPLIDQLGRDDSLQTWSDRRPESAPEGLTRSLRPYRWGDPIRLVHWRSSARYGELRVRELETLTGGNNLVIALDSAPLWQADDFEQAVIAAASLYFYAQQQQLNVRLWTAGTGLIHGQLPVLEVLAAIQPGETVVASPPTQGALIWLTQNPESLAQLWRSCRWLLWDRSFASLPHETLANNRIRPVSPGMVLHPEKSLQEHLQSQVLAF